MSKVLAFFLGVACVAAVPTMNPNSEPFIATFEGLPVNFITPLLSPVGVYEGLKWNFVANQPGLLGNINGLKQQGKRAAARAQIPALLLGQDGNVSIPTDSSIKSFDLYSFLYGCFPGTVSNAIGFAFSCVITVSGERKGGKDVPTQTFSFAVDLTDIVDLKTFELLSADMALGQLSDFTGLSSAKFDVAVAAIPGVDPVLLVDNVYGCRKY